MTTTTKFASSFLIAVLVAVIAIEIQRPHHKPAEAVAASAAPSVSTALVSPVTSTTAAPKPVVTTTAPVRRHVTTTASTVAPRSAELESRIPGPNDDLSNYGGIFCPDKCEDVSTTTSTVE